MTSDELKPCPFCGGKAVIDGIRFKNFWTVECQGCECAIRGGEGMQPDDDGFTDLELIHSHATATWNQRFEDTDEAKVRELVKKAKSILPSAKDGSIADQWHKLIEQQARGAMTGRQSEATDASAALESDQIELTDDHKKLLIKAARHGLETMLPLEDTETLRDLIGLLNKPVRVFIESPSDAPESPQSDDPVTLDDGGGWLPFDTAPKDRTIQARIPGHGADNIIQWTSGFMDVHGEPCSCWIFTEDQEPPDSWSDGVCWEVNEDGEKSILPTHWKEIGERGK